MSRMAVLFIFAICISGCTNSSNVNVVSVSENADAKTLLKQNDTKSATTDAGENSLFKQVNNAATAIQDNLPMLDDPKIDPVLESPKPKVNKPFVVYANRDIKKGEVIVLDSLMHRELDASKVPADAISNGSSIVGSKAKEAIHKGQIVRSFELDYP